MSKSIPEISVDAQHLAKRLETVKPGEVVTYSELSALVKRDVQHGAAGILFTARRIMQREKKAVFAAVRGIGIKRLEDSGIVSQGEAAVASINRAARRNGRKLGCADYDKLNAAERVKFNTSACLLGTLELATKPSRVKQLSESVESSAKQLPTAEVLALFTK